MIRSWVILLFPLSVFSQRQYSTAELKNGKFKDDSSYIYSLPFEHKKKVFLVQGYEGLFSHKGERALDFKVKMGTKVCAARAGVVTSTREDSDVGGLKPENLSDGNYIFIRHSDGSIANYWHFKKDGVLVNVGDTVVGGQLIGYSGNTGYSAFPHLHFEVQGYDASGNYVQLPTRFYTQLGIIYLRPGKIYKTFHP
ncbi:MAG TPA: M23 family metallopeptidase [Chitinophagaceae bacterium]|nr:M23 family metallopeptidase [Chitinophagaceae bacterium]